MLIQQYKPHMKAIDFKKLISVRDKFITDIDGHIKEQNDVAELFYKQAHLRKGEARFRQNMDGILVAIK
ncbi:MAG: hypothetical protein JKX83_09285 [Pseudomonadales bacterium]|nr:hypothetical protein [Pseudomonadales bacterium]